MLIVPVAGRRLVWPPVTFWSCEYPHDPAGIAEVAVQCFQFSMGGTNKVKLATGRLLVGDPDYFQSSFEIGVPIPDNAAFGKWGIQVIEFTNCRGYKTSF